MDKKERLTQIVKEVQKDIGQFELLYSHIVDQVYFLCYMIVKNEATAKDLTQESMIQIYKKINIVHTPEVFLSWMYKLVRNICYNYLRANQRLDKLFPDSDDYTDKYENTLADERKENIPNEAYDLKETKHLIQAFINNLPRMQREVIILFYLEEMKISEIAEILDYNIGSVKSRLHAGRKNLEQQVSNYQKKNNVKLYSTSVLPLLGFILNEYRAELCCKQNLKYNKNIYGSSNSSILGKILQVLSNKVILFATVLCVTAIVATASIPQNQISNGSEKEDINTYKLDDLGEFDKSKKHPYIKDITYLTFPMRTEVDVKIELREGILEEDIKVLFNNEELSFDKNEKDILVQVTENGVYTIITNKYKTKFKISNIDINAPELVGFNVNDTYLELIINDELSQIDYQRSYIEYQGMIYDVTGNLEIYGNFKGKVEVVIYHVDGYKIIYELNCD